MDTSPSRRVEDLERALAEAERKLTEARLQITDLESLLEDLPGIFERKFQQRLQPVLERQQLLQADNSALQQQLRQLAAAPERAEHSEEAAAQATEPQESVSRSNAGVSSLALPQLPERSLQRRTRRRRAA